MNTRDNQRAKNTQRKIREVFIGLIAGKSIQQISVQEICRGANIHRATFYAHYDDLNDLMQNIEMEMEQGISNLFYEPGSGVYKSLTEKNLEKLINYVYENAVFYRVYLNDFNNIKSFDKTIAASWKQEIEPVLKKQADKTEAELHYQFEYFNSGLHGVIRKWLNTDCQESPAEVTGILMKCIHL